jgi:hypothetical protein
LEDVVSTETEESTIAYATPSPRGGSPVLAGAAILLGGLGLIVLGGCFLIGVLIASSAARESAVQGGPGLTPSMILLEIVLYVAAFACFAGAVTMLVIGTRSLLRPHRA